MDLPARKSSENKKTIKIVSIDGIIEEINNLNLKNNSKIESNNKDFIEDNQSPKKSKESNDYFLSILKALSKLNVVIPRRDENIKLKTQELYEVLKTAIGSEFYLIILSFVSKFIKGYKPNSSPLKSSVKYFFEIVIEKTDNEIQNLLPEDTYNLLIDLNNIETEPAFYKILDSIKNSIESNAENDNDFIKTISLVYIYVILKTYNRTNFYNELFIVEYLICRHLAEIESSEVDSNLLKLLPSILIEPNRKTKVRSFIHLYLTKYNSQLKNNYDILKLELDFYKSDSVKLSEEVGVLSEKVLEKETKINHLNEEIENKDNSMADLEKSVERLNERFVNIENSYQNQLQELRTNLFTKLNKDFHLEIEGLTSIANRLQPNDSKILLMYIDNIKYIINSFTNRI